MKGALIVNDAVILAGCLVGRISFRIGYIDYFERVGGDLK